MHNSLKTLIEDAGQDISKRRKESQEISGIILGFSGQKNEEKLLLKQISLLKKYVKEIIISIPDNWNPSECDVLRSSDGDFVTKYIDRPITSSPYSIEVFDLLQKTCMYDKILFISHNHKISSNKIEKLISQESSLSTFLGINGNFLPSIGFYDKWTNRFNIQILKINQNKVLDDLFRVSSDKIFLKLSSSDCICEWVPEDDNQINSISEKARNLYVPLRFHSELDPQDLVKMIALLHVLRTDIEEKGETISKFRIQQLLFLSRKFFNSKNYFLAFQILQFFILNKENIRNLPEDWNMDKILTFSRRQLLEESRFYSRNNLERFRLHILNDLKSQQLMKKTDERWIEGEINKLQKILESDNIVFM
jgi:hypothetical protein